MSVFRDGDLVAMATCLQPIDVDAVALEQASELVRFSLGVPRDCFTVDYSADRKEFVVTFTRDVTTEFEWPIHEEKP